VLSVADDELFPGRWRDGQLPGVGEIETEDFRIGKSTRPLDVRATTRARVESNVSPIFVVTRFAERAPAAIYFLKYVFPRAAGRVHERGRRALRREREQSVGVPVFFEKLQRKFGNSFQRGNGYRRRQHARDGIDRRVHRQQK